MKYRVLVTRKDGFDEHYWKGRETDPDPRLLKRALEVLQRNASIPYINILAQYIASETNRMNYLPGILIDVPKHLHPAIANRAYPLIRTSRLRHFVSALRGRYLPYPKWVGELALNALNERPYEVLKNDEVLELLADTIQHTYDRSLLDQWHARLVKLSHTPSTEELKHYLELAIKQGEDNIEPYAEVVKRWTRVFDEVPPEFLWVVMYLPGDVAAPILGGLLQNPNLHVVASALRTGFWEKHPEHFAKHLPKLLKHPNRMIRNYAETIVFDLLLSAANMKRDDERRAALQWVKTVNRDPAVVDTLRYFIQSKRRWQPQVAEALEPILSDYGIKLVNE